MVEIRLPRFVQPKKLKTGRVAYYWAPPGYWRNKAEAEGRTWGFESVPLGEGLDQVTLEERAAPLNARFDEWREGGVPKDGPVRRYAAYGSVEWLFEEYQRSKAFERRVAERSRGDYAIVFRQIAEQPTKDGRRFGQFPIASVTPAAADKIYTRMIEGGKFRRGEKALMYAKTAWKMMQPLFPKEFSREVPNPWEGVQRVQRQKAIKAAVDRETVYRFATAALEQGRPECAAAAVICFEWLQRPENVVCGHITWNDYRGPAAPSSVRIEHHKTGAMVMHPLEEIGEDGAVTLFYADAEAVLGKLPRRGLRMILGPDGQAYKPTRFGQIVARVAKRAGLSGFTLDACRHGGMTELEEAGLTDGQGRALSAHTSKAYEGYAKRTEKRVLDATKRRHAFRKGD